MTEIRVPDIGDFTDVPVIEIHVAAGDEVSVEDPLVTLESDKATMDVPAPSAGVVKQLRVSIGDRVSEGSVLLTLDGATEDGAAARRRLRDRPTPTPTAETRPHRQTASIDAGSAASGRAATASRDAQVRGDRLGPGRLHAPRSAPPTSGCRRSWSSATRRSAGSA